MHLTFSPDMNGVLMGECWHQCLKAGEPGNIVSKMKQEFAELFKLGRAERLQLVEDLWDSIAQESSSSRVADWKLQELRQRKNRLQADPSSGQCWEQIKARARKAND
jgi:putative addiction module component (TIGR02574 family)